MTQDQPTAPPKPVRRGSDAITVVLVAAAVVALLAMVVADRLSSDSGAASAAASPTSAPAAGGGVAGEGAAPAPSTSVDAATAELQELDGTASAAAPAAAVTGDCVMEVLSLRVGATGNSVACLQKALADAGLYAGPQNGTFDNATYLAVRKAQEARNLFVDGVVGRETALSLGVWPDEESFVVRTPPPAAGAVDAMGYRLSSVASTGASAPPLPPNSGSGRRVVYDRAGQRVWAVDKNNNIVRSWLVSGSQYSNEVPGTAQGLQPLGGVDGVERQGLPAQDDPLLPDQDRPHRLPRHPAEGVRPLRLPDRGAARDPAVGWLPAPGQPRRRLPVGLRPGRHPRRRHLTGPARREDDAVRLRIDGYRLPGRTFCECRNVHVALQVRQGPEGLTPGDAPSAAWDLDVALVVDEQGALDFRGPAVHGKRGERFLYLTWGDVGDDGSFEMFRRAKLMLNRVDPALVRGADQRDVPLVARVELTDGRGGPRCARVDPPAIAWSV